MSLDLRLRLFNELDALVLVDPHTHINPLDPASHTLGDILGYHYYTELAHSTGLAKDRIEDPSLDPREKVRRLIENLGPLDNTIQHSWFIEMAQSLLGLETSEVNASNWEGLYEAAVTLMSQRDWPQQVLARSKLEAVFLTNDFDDALEGFDTSVYIPCLRTDDLVFHLAKPQVRQRLERATGIAASDAQALRRAISGLFKHFKSHGARACAISLPPDFAPQKVSAARANTALAAINADGTSAAESHRRAIGNFVFWTLAEMCADYRLPFDLMIGVNRGVYEGGVHQGRDLYDSRVSLVQYKELFNAFPQVCFPISVLASVTNQELTSYAWIFPNVVTNGHWWYSNTPTFIEHDLAARLEAVPRTKQIGYYSDMYKLEFALPKFAMYKRILAKVLAERFVIDRGWSEEQAVALGTQVLRGNVETIFRWGEDLRGEMPVESIAKVYDLNPSAQALAGDESQEVGGAALAAGAGGLGLLQPSDEMRIEPQTNIEEEPLDLLPSGEPGAEMPAAEGDGPQEAQLPRAQSAIDLGMGVESYVEPAASDSMIDLDDLRPLESRIDPYALPGSSVVDLDVPESIYDSPTRAEKWPGPAAPPPEDNLEALAGSVVEDDLAAASPGQSTKVGDGETVFEAEPNPDEEAPLANRQTEPFQFYNLDAEAEAAVEEPKADEPADAPGNWDFLKKDEK